MKQKKQHISNPPFKIVKCLRVPLKETTGDDEMEFDVLIEAERFVVCIEFKINHDLDNPLKKYQDYVEGTYPDKQHIFLVLSPYRKDPVGSAKKDLEEGTKFKLVILSHFFKHLNLKDTASNRYEAYFNDLVQTVKNREIRYRRHMLLNEIGGRLQPALNSEFHRNSEGGYLQFDPSNFIVKVRIVEEGNRLDRCGRDFKVISQKKLDFTNDLDSLKKEIKMLSC